MANRIDSGDDEPPTEGSSQPNGEGSGNRTVTAERGWGVWRRRSYRVAIVALGVLGVVFGAGGVAFVDARPVLFALAGTGAFGAVLLYALVPERFVTATLGYRTHAPLAEVGPLLLDTLSLADRRVYLPANDGRVRLFVPRDDVTSVPESGKPAVGVHDDGVFRGVVLPTTGDGLLAEFHDRSDRTLAPDPEAALTQLLDALVEEFELVERANGRTHRAEGRATITVEGSCYGPVTTFDHPVAAFLAAGLATGLGTPVTLDPPRGDEYDRRVIVCRWKEPLATADTWDHTQ